jgi:hypothetical protein
MDARNNFRRTEKANRSKGFSAEDVLLVEAE